ncbi:glutamine synthetase family protein [Thioalkalivibrio sp. HK1]|uniref:glutamine synthetase family protein n=1 Tax=Thioalkalivibrio sp. HK1 TaxID=1469245 RepID=UPI000471D53B|nr:glutamine synthetase family protein [Thioalkalivibrio sp. HK1]
MNESIEQWCAKRSILEIEALMPDMAGVARGKVMPRNRYCHDLGLNLPEALILQTVSGDYPEDWSAVDPSDRDMVLRPDESTIRLVPWATEPTAQIIHDCFHADGTPVETTSRYVLRRVLDLYREHGWQPIVAPELEFYLVKRNEDADYPLEPPVGRSGQVERGRQSFGIDILNEYDPLVDDIYNFCEKQEIELGTLSHETGVAQLEINLSHGDPLLLADQAFVFKRTVREAARRHGICATFMAKPMEREPGSAMHLHQSVVDIATGENVFATEDGAKTRLFHSHIGGLQNYLPAAMSFLAPNVNSYRRITKYFAAPINLQWGIDNRTAGLRVPLAKSVSTRVENRVAGADANPYLAIAASLACGLLGMIEERQPTAAIEGSAYKMPYGLPLSLAESLRLLGECPPLTSMLGERFVHAWNAVKECELHTFSQVISSWEREFLLRNV